MLTYCLLAMSACGCATEGFKTSLDKGAVGRPLPETPVPVKVLPTLPPLPGSMSL